MPDVARINIGTGVTVYTESDGNSPPVGDVPRRVVDFNAQLARGELESGSVAAAPSPARAIRGRSAALAGLQGPAPES